MPRTRTAVICLDGVDPDYLDDAFERDLTPRLRELAASGAYLRGRSQLPSFTNPNNISIVTGATPAVHGLPGNHYLAPDGKEVQLDDPEMLRAGSIHAAFAGAGVPVLAVTTKEKLRRLLGKDGVPSVSAEHADQQSLPGLVDDPVSTFVRRARPGIYDWDCSHYALELGLALANELGIELLYVSLTDAVQHAAAPGDELSDRYLVLLDELVGRYLDADWRLALVADHGMNAKTRPDGTPNVRFLGDILALERVECHVVLPITDPYIAHHAALGSACWIHAPEHQLEAARAVLQTVDGVEEVMSREQAAAELSLPPDRIGDLVVLGDATTVFGKRAVDHDLSALRGPLRSHGGRHEQEIPILLSVKPPPLEPGVPSNADVHALVLGAG